MPNKTIYLNAINTFEERIGFSFIQREDLEKRLQEAWKKDKTKAKVDYLTEYGRIFRELFKTWGEHEMSKALTARSAEMPALKECLLKTDETLKVCALALIPELRDNEDVLSNMTFGVIEANQLQSEVVGVVGKYSSAKTAEKAMKQRKEAAYNQYKGTWKETLTHITEVVKDEEALNGMSQDEKITYALALESYFEEKEKNASFGAEEKETISNALSAWSRALGCQNGETIDDFVAAQHYQYAQKFLEREWVTAEVNSAIAEYDKVENPAKAEIARYKEEDARQRAEKLEKEHTIHNEGVTDDTAEMVGDFFMQEELTQELEEVPTQKERKFLEDKVADFNEKYSLRIDKVKLRTSIEQVSALMVKAREEKERYLSKDGVVVIENGEEKYYTAKEYFKSDIEDAHKRYLEEIKRLEEDRAKAEQEYKSTLETIERQEKLLTKVALEKLKTNAEKALKDQSSGIDKAMAHAKQELQEALEKTEGGVVIEKNGDTEKRTKAAKYYETHETKKEQNAYGEYQHMFSRIYKDACRNLKEKNYAKGEVADFSAVARDVDKLFKSAMYLSGIYDDERNKEVVQKCSFGAFSAEKLSKFVIHIDGDKWAENQSSEKVWALQLTQAKNIFSQWAKEEQRNPKVKPAVRVKETLDKQCELFKKGAIPRKVMLDYMLAADAHLQKHYPTNAKKVGSLIQYNRERRALMRCRIAMGLPENASLRVAMNNEYVKISNLMSTEEVFKGIGVRMTCLPTFKEEKRGLEEEHQAVRDQIVSEKLTQLEELRAKDREPISIPQLNEKDVILNQEPRSQPVQAPVQPQQTLRLNNK